MTKTRKTETFHVRCCDKFLIEIRKNLLVSKNKVEVDKRDSLLNKVVNNFTRDKKRRVAINDMILCKRVKYE